MTNVVYMKHIYNFVALESYIQSSWKTERKKERGLRLAQDFLEYVFLDFVHGRDARYSGRAFRQAHKVVALE